MLFMKMFRDMKLHKTQFASIFLMAFLGVFIYAGIGAEWRGLKKNVTDYYKDTNFADVWLLGPSFSEEDEEKLETLDGVRETERKLVLDAVGKFHNNPKISMHIIRENQISKLYLVNGEDFSTDKDGIWIADRFAKAQGLNVGDKMSVTYDGIAIEKKILGTVYSPEYVFLADGGGMSPDFSAYGYAYLSYKYFPVPDKLIYNELMLTTDTENQSSLEKNIHSALKGNYSVFLTRENESSYAMFKDEIDQHKAMGSIFPVAFLAIALLTLLTTMTRIVNHQRIQIGTLKAIGFKRKKILYHYMSYGFWLSLSGSVLGAAVGPLTLPKLFYPSMSGFYTLPKWNSHIDLSFYIMAVVTTFLCTFVTYFACRNVLKDTPSKTLRPRAPKNVKHGILEKTALWEKSGFNFQWNFRDIMRNRVRSSMAVIGVLGCTALLVCAFGMYDDMNDLKDWQYKDINQFKSELIIDKTANKEQIQNAIQSTNGQAIMEVPIEIKANDKRKTGIIKTTDHVTLIKNTDKDGNNINLPDDGVSITYKMANLLGVKKGDEITWHIFEDKRWVTTKVAEVYREPSSQGITITRETLEKLGYTFSPTSILTSSTIKDTPAGISTITDTQKLSDDWDNLTLAMMTMVYVLIASAAILAVVVLYNLGLLSFTEMERELATLKVIGLKSKKLRHLLLSQNLLLSIIGFILGVPTGKWLIVYMTSTMGDSFDMITRIHLSNILLSLVITFALSILVNLMFSRKIRCIDMVASLKSVD